MLTKDGWGWQEWDMEERLLMILGDYSDVGWNMSLVGCGGIWAFWITLFFYLKIEWGEVLCTVFG